jgi:hypothetical protein
MLDSEYLEMALEKGVQASWFEDPRLFADLIEASGTCTWNTKNSLTVLSGHGLFKRHKKAAEIAEAVPRWAFNIEDVSNAFEVLAVEHSRDTLTNTLVDARNRLVEGEDPFQVAGMLAGTVEEIDSLGGGDRSVEQLCDDALVLDTKIANGEQLGLPFPWGYFQDKTFGIPYDAVTPMGGRDGTGKSRLATFLTEFWARQGIPILYFAFEDGAERFISNVAASAGQYDMFTIKRGPVDADFMEKHAQTLRKVAKYPVYAEDYPCTAEKMMSVIARYKRKYGIRGVVIDGFKDMIPTIGENQTTKENHMTSVLVRAAKRYNVSIIPVSHINKIEDRKWISKRDITGAGNQFKSARMVLMYQDFIPDKIRREYNAWDDEIVLDCTKASYGQRAITVLRPDLEHGRFIEVPKADPRDQRGPDEPREGERVISGGATINPAVI